MDWDELHKLRAALYAEMAEAKKTSATTMQVSGLARHEAGGLSDPELRQANFGVCALHPIAAADNGDIRFRTEQAHAGFIGLLALALKTFAGDDFDREPEWVLKQ